MQISFCNIFLTTLKIEIKVHEYTQVCVFVSYIYIGDCQHNYLS